MDPVCGHVLLCDIGPIHSNKMHAHPALSSY
jgi:hypothetical protein